MWCIRECKRNNDKCVWYALGGTIYGTPDNNLIIAPKVVFQDLYKGVQKSAPKIAQKDALPCTLELHLFIELSMHNSVQYDSVKD